MFKFTLEGSAFIFRELLLSV